jgi:hypothetical protein
MSMLLPIGEAVIVAGIYHGVVRNFDDKQQKILVKFDGWPESSASWYPPDKVLSLQHSGRNARRASTGANKVQPVPALVPARRNSAAKADDESDEESKPSLPAATVGSKRPRAKGSREPGPRTKTATRPSLPHADSESSDEEIPAGQPLRKAPVRQAPDEHPEIESQEMAQHLDGPLQYEAKSNSPAEPVRAPAVSTITPTQSDDASAHSRSISATCVIAGLHVPALSDALAAQPGGTLRLKVVETLPMNPSLSDTDISVLVSTSWAVPDADTKERLLEGK